MEQRRVGSSGLQVSRLGLGTLTWGRDTAPQVAYDLMATFVDAGGTLIDTAAAYGAGDAEEILGALMAREFDREDLVIATKAGFGVRGGERVVDTSARTMLADLDASMERLGTDWIDLWQVHAWGPAPIEETLAAMDHAVASGRVRYIGLSNFVGWQTAQAASWQRAITTRTPIAATQVEYSLMTRRAEVEILPAVRAMGLGFLAWSPLGRGVLTGKYRRGIPKDSRAAAEHFAWFVDPYLQPRSRAIVDAVARAADGLGMAPLEVALLWVRDAPGVTASLLGARTPEQLEECLAVEEMSLPAEIAAALDDVSGGPMASRDGAGRLSEPPTGG